MTVDYRTYDNEKQSFIKKHSQTNWKIETSSMDEYGRYHKEYVFEDGAIWYEVMSPEWFKMDVEVEINFCKVKRTIEVKMFRTEFWSTDDSHSKYYYEEF